MNDNILATVKKIIGIVPEYTHFDQDILIHINSILLVLSQLGIGPSTPVVADENTTWDAITYGDPGLEGVKSYVPLRVRMIFDPPQSSSTAEAIKNSIAELEWRLNIYAESNS